MKLSKLLKVLGMIPVGSITPPHATPLLSVILDGRIVGEAEEGLMTDMARELRRRKAIGDTEVL